MYITDVLEVEKSFTYEKKTTILPNKHIWIIFIGMCVFVCLKKKAIWAWAVEFPPCPKHIQISVGRK